MTANPGNRRQSPPAKPAAQKNAPMTVIRASDPGEWHAQVVGVTHIYRENSLIRLKWTRRSQVVVVTGAWWQSGIFRFRPKRSLGPVGILSTPPHRPRQGDGRGPGRPQSRVSCIRRACAPTGMKGIGSKDRVKPDFGWLRPPRACGRKPIPSKDSLAHSRANETSRTGARS